MARIRTIKPAFWTDEDLSELPEATLILAASLLNYADDEGFFNANPKLIKAECCPLREPSVSIQDSLNTLAKMGWLRLGNGASGKRYGHITNFTEHQRINRPTESKIKELDIVWEGSTTAQPQLSEDSLLEGKGKERKGKDGENKNDEPKPAKPKTRKSNNPTYLADSYTRVLPDEWRDFGRTRGWTDWQINEVWEDFWRYFTGPDAKDPKKIDWYGAWQRWCRTTKPPRADKQTSRSQQQGSGVQFTDELKRLTGDAC